MKRGQVSIRKSQTNVRKDINTAKRLKGENVCIRKTTYTEMGLVGAGYKFRNPYPFLHRLRCAFTKKEGKLPVFLFLYVVFVLMSKAC